jgi:hypothetical protein
LLVFFNPRKSFHHQHHNYQNNPTDPLMTAKKFLNLTLEACGANNTRRQLCRTPLVLCSLPIKTEQRVTRGASLLMAMIATFFCATAGANVLFWDAGNTNGNGLPITAGSGGWDTDTTTNFNWNDGTTNLSWW